MIDLKHMTFGVEHELGDWPHDRPLPRGLSHNRKDYTCVNTTGIANDPLGKTYRFGGEINTAPTDDPEGQAELLNELLSSHPEAVINYRSNLHVHIKVPGLSENLDALKRFVRYNMVNVKTALELVEPIPSPCRSLPAEEYNGARRRYRRRISSHHTVVPHQFCEAQLSAPSVNKFFELGVPASKIGRRPLWHTQRAAVNLQHLRTTGTIEFRHFPGTLDPHQLIDAIQWCAVYTAAALNSGATAQNLFYSAQWRFPQFMDYIHWMEKRYRATCLDGTLSRALVEENIKKIEAGRFDNHEPRRLPL